MYILRPFKFRYNKYAYDDFKKLKLWSESPFNSDHYDYLTMCYAAELLFIPEDAIINRAIKGIQKWRMGTLLASNCRIIGKSEKDIIEMKNNMLPRIDAQDYEVVPLSTGTPARYFIDPNNKKVYCIDYSINRIQLCTLYSRFTMSSKYEKGDLIKINKDYHWLKEICDNLGCENWEMMKDY